jgi:ATPase family associated with various cellular activities (AAA)
MKTPLVDIHWLSRTRTILKVYGAISVRLPLTEKCNTPRLIEELAINGDWQVITAKIEENENRTELFTQIESNKDVRILWVFENIIKVLENPDEIGSRELEQSIIDAVVGIKNCNSAILFLDYCETSLPRSISPLIPKQEIDLPSRKIIELILAEFDIVDAGITTIVGGLGAEEIRTGVRLAYTSNDRSLEATKKSLLAYKIRQLKEMGLGFIAEPDVPDFGGLDLLRGELQKVKMNFSPAAREYGLPLPRGWLLVGPPGTGKTHTAKCVAVELNMPLISVGIDTIKSGGADLFKALLARVEAAEPCVVYFDELDKFISEDVDPQIFGLFLTWLQEKRSTTFTIATANRIGKLPPELTRMGRIDKTYWVGFPSEGERFEIIKLYAVKFDDRYSSEFGALTIEEWVSLLADTDGFTGAELKSLVDKAAEAEFIEHFNDPIKQPLRLNLVNLLAARKIITPLKEKNPAGILEIEKQAKKISEPASSPDKSIFKLERIDMYG